ncbi:MAG TPA: 30S ribosome-binding factor RbfA [Candidatus Dormibacteraeota bacterium]|nr:30S ribosome-binding factor RbfA [Candidatus Dormibacteraeota bacterium]
MPGHHRERLVEEMRQEIEAMLAGELKDPRLTPTIFVSEVRLGPDRGQAKVFVSVQGTEAERAAVINALEAAAGFIRFELAERLQLRRSPRLEFMIDRSAEYGARIEELLRQEKRTPDH